MIKQKPVFVEGNILTKEMLTAVTEFAYAYPMCLYTGYSDGIISGFSVTTTKERIVIEKGLVCFDGVVFVFAEDMELPYYISEDEVYLKLKYGGCKEERSHVAYAFSLEIDDVLPEKNELEICRFRLQRDAELRYIYDDFEDFQTEYDTINRIHTLVASKEVPTMQADILNRFAKEMLAVHIDDPLDIQFCMQILSTNQPLPMHGICAYLHLKLEVPFVVRSHGEVFLKLLQILEGERAKGRTGKVRSSAGKRKIMIE